MRNLKLFSLLGVFVVVALVTRQTWGRSINGIVESDFTNIYTDNVHNYTKWGIMVMDRPSFVFRIKACSDAHLALVSTWGVHYNVTDVVIGCCHNTNSMIRSGADRTHYADAVTPDVLSCAEFRTFWIHWMYEYIEVGWGPIPNSQVMMRARRVGSLNFPVRFIAFSTGWDYTGVWQIPQNQGYYLFLYTPDDFMYNYAWRSVQQARSHFVFHVKACHDVHVAMASEEGKVKYEAFIGGMSNTKSVIRTGGEDKVWHIENDITSCDEFRHFWISWFGNTIRVGKGERVYRHHFLEWTDPAFVPINWVSISTGHGSDGMWTIVDYWENEYFYHTQGRAPAKALITNQSNTSGSLQPKSVQLEYNEHPMEKYVGTDPHGQDVIPRDIPDNGIYNMWVLAPMSYFVYFRVMSCGDARVVLSQNQGLVDDTSQQIYIGAYDNTRSGVFSPYSPVPIIDISTPDILNCGSFKGFFVSWWHYGDTTRVEFGEADDVHFKPLFTWNITDEINFVDGIGFGAPEGKGAEFILWRNTGTEANITIPTTQEYPVTVRSYLDFFFQFRVIACRNVRLFMTSVELQGTESFYIIEIGRDGNKIILRDLTGDALITKEFETNFLSCNHHRSFWIGWLDGNLHVGRGFKYGNDELLRYDVPIPHLIDVVGIGSINVTANYQFESDAMDIIYMLANNPLEYKWLMLRSDHEHWLFFEVLGTMGARLLLSNKYRDTSDTFSIYIGADLNTRCAIYKGNVEKKGVITPNILHATELRSFWVSWRRGTIALGYEKMREALKIIEHTDSAASNINSVGITTIDSSVQTEWKFYEPFFREISYDTSVLEGARLYNQLWMSVRNRIRLVLGIQSCGHAEIILSAAMFNYEWEYYYRLEIQSSHNKTELWLNHRRILADTDTPGILQCDREHHFWLTWHEGAIAFGHGFEIGNRPIVSYQDLNAFPVTAVGLLTRGNKTIWRAELEGGAGFFFGQQSSSGLSGGEIAGVVIGVFLVLGMIVGGAYLILRPPEPLRPYLDPAGTTTVGGSTSSPAAPSTSSEEPRVETPRQKTGTAEVPTSFENILFSEDSEVA